MKQIKLIKNYLLAVLYLLSCIACESELNILPISKRHLNNYYKTEAEIESAVTGVYAQLQSNGLYGLDLIGVGEISGENSFEEVPANDSGRFGQLDDFSTNAQNNLVGNIWRESYKAIQRANTVLNRISDISYTDKALKEQRIGEMHFVRALLYFNLVRLYGDVPLVLIETTDTFAFFGQGRTEKLKVYEQIEIELTRAIELLPLLKSAGRPARGAAQALLSELKLTHSDFAGALSILEQLVKSKNYSLMPTTSDIFGQINEGNNEILFEIQFASGIIANGKNEGSSAGSQFRPSGVTANAKGHNLPTKQFISTFENGDTRLRDYAGLEPDKSPLHYSLKYEISSTGPDDGGSDHIIIRWAEVLLNYAEALNETGNTQAALVQLNKIRNRAKLADTKAKSQEEVRQAIRQERQFEFFGEGKRWFNLKRYGNAVATMNAFFLTNKQKTNIDENNLLLPIPQSQIDTDPDYIIQNPGY
ncbi:MAG: RagB/SusD family nutrient uptake outer membrane protein [Tenacibaculum sp.]